MFWRLFAADASRKRTYDSVSIPSVIEALGSQNKVRLYYETANDFAGIGPGAIWEDFRIGIEHLSRWERVAVVTDVEWIKQTVHLFGFLMPAAVISFAASETASAREWIAATN